MMQFVKRFRESLALIGGSLILSGLSCLVYMPTSWDDYSRHNLNYSFFIVAAAIVFYYKPWQHLRK